MDGKLAMKHLYGNPRTTEHFATCLLDGVGRYKDLLYQWLYKTHKNGMKKIEKVIILVFNKKGMQRFEGSLNSACYTSSTFALLSLLSFLIFIAGRSPSTFGRHRATCAASRTGGYTRRQWH